MGFKYTVCKTVTASSLAWILAILPLGNLLLSGS